MIKYALLWFLAYFILFLIAWVVRLREWLRCKPWPWSQKLFAAIEPIEIALWNKSETILWARFKVLFAVLYSLLQMIGTFDMTVVLPFIPEKHRWWITALPPLALAADGVIQEALRRYTTKPVALVEVPDYTPVPAAVREAVAMSDSTKLEAVAVVKEAQKEGTV